MKLCYVYGHWAYFTKKPIHEQWGDDWNDAPYEHNAGEPYDYALKVAWEGPLEEPSEGHLNSPYSVEQINAGQIAWLRTDKWITPAQAIMAGATIGEFIDGIYRAGGTVFLPVYDWGEK